MKLLMNFSCKKLFLNILVIGCMVVPCYIIYETFVTHRINYIPGIIVIAVDIIALFWNISVLSHYKYNKPGFVLTFIAMLSISIALSYAHIRPLEKARIVATEFVNNIIENRNTEAQYNVYINHALPDTNILYGRYLCVMNILSTELNIYSDGTYMKYDLAFPAEERGYIKADSQYVYFLDTFGELRNKYKYTYSTEFECLILYDYYFSDVAEFYRR